MHGESVQPSPLSYGEKLFYKLKNFGFNVMLKLSCTNY